MRAETCFLFATCAIYWLPSNVGSLSNTLTTGYRGNSVATSLGARDLPMVQRGVQRSRRLLQTSRDASTGAKMNVKRKKFWKGNKGGPLPLDEILGKHNDGQLTDYGPSHKAMRYG